MPITLTVHVNPASHLPVHQRSEPSWRRLHRIADAAYPELQSLWATLFADVRASIPEVALREALASGNALLVEEVLAPVWARLGDAPARSALPVVVRETVRQAAEAMLPSLRATLGVTVDVAFHVVVPETLAVIDAYVGREILGISDLTMHNVRQVIRTGFSEGRSLMQMMRDLETSIGLTPRQTQRLAQLRDRLTADGLPGSQIRQRVQEASRRALRQRVENIARSESMMASNMGAHQLLVQNVEQGLLDVDRVRRHWLVAADRRLCPRCAPVPSMNPDGVRLRQSFTTPAGDVLHPPLHPMCRCTVNTNII